MVDLGVVKDSSLSVWERMAASKTEWVVVYVGDGLENDGRNPVIRHSDNWRPSNIIKHLPHMLDMC